MTTHEKSHSRHGANASAHSKPYRGLLVMAVLSFVAMYGLMYAMVDRFANVHNNLNQVYMAGLMTAPMIVFELLLMRSMYGDRRANVIIAIASIVLLLGCFMAIRTQLGIGDKQFLRSMIPHHASAILMCEHAGLSDPAIEKLCENIRKGQQSEIDFMTAKLKELDK